MLVFTWLVPFTDVIFGLTQETIGGIIFHPEAYLTGRSFGALHFCAIYSCIVARIICNQLKTKGGWILPLLFSLLLIGLGGFSFFAHYKSEEHISLLGFHLEGFHLRQFASGSISIIPAIAAVMVISPILIPAQALASVAQMFNKDFRTGSKDLDEYLNARQNSQNRRQNGPQLSDQEVPCPDVLLVEDDLAGAALVLKFCKKLKLQCVHVESLDEAKVIFEKHQDRLRLILLDHFVRVLDAKTNGPKTGAEWAKELNHNFPKGDRFFHIAILTGHSHLLNELSQEANIVLQKPWDPKELFRYLKQNNIA